MAGDLHDVRGVLAIAPFRRLWVALSLSSLGDWLGLLATTALSTELVHGYAAKSYALGGVLIVRLLPALFLGPVGGALADRIDRRKTMVVCDVLRFALFLSIPVVRTLPWLIAASFLIEALSLFWIPAKEASVPNLVPKERLEAANQLSLLTTYGTAPLASAAFALLALLNSALAAGFSFFKTNSVDLALYFDAATFLFSAATVYQLHEIGGKRVGRVAGESAPGVLRDIREGWRFVGRDRLVRGIVIGMLGAFAAGGTVVALGRLFVLDLRAGNAGYGVLFGTLFVGLALGMFAGPRLLHGFSRRRLLGLAITGAGVALVFDALSPNLLIAVLLTFFVGGFAGVAWVVGYTLVGKNVADSIRGRTFSFLYTMMRVDLLFVLAVAPFVAGTIGPHHVGLFSVRIRLDGTTLTLLVGGLLAIVVGLVSYRLLDDRPGVPLWREAWAAVRRFPVSAHADAGAGLFIAFEGGEGAGKSTQVQLLRDWLAGLGYEVHVTHEPGATPVGRRLRELLLDPASRGMSARAEALIYAADRADHVEREIWPLLHEGTVVLTDRYVDSSLAYQGAGRRLPLADIERISRWATGQLRPDLTVVLDVDPVVGLARGGGPGDRIEAESLAFHSRVRAAFLRLGERDRRHVVVDATRPVDEVAAAVRARVEPLLTAVHRRVPERTR